MMLLWRIDILCLWQGFEFSQVSTYYGSKDTLLCDGRTYSGDIGLPLASFGYGTLKINKIFTITDQYPDKRPPCQKAVIPASYDIDGSRL